MYLIYTSVLTLGLLLTLPYYIVRFRKYFPTIGERLGFIESGPEGPTIWVHAVSVGEVRAVDRLISGIRDRFAEHRIVVSTTTPTGRGLALELTDVDRVVYFPLDLPCAVRRSLDQIQPDLVMMAETEIWPNFLRQCGLRGIPVLMVNGRISDKSFPRYLKGRRWLGRVLNGYWLLGMQSGDDARRIGELGADPSKVAVFGNLKYDLPSATPKLNRPLIELLEASQPLIVAASTAAQEETLVLEAFRAVCTDEPAAKLLIAPRLADRFDEVEALLRTSGLTYCRRSRIADTADGADVILLDSIGELSGIFEYATLVFMGGTLVPRGGHNLLEPARFAKPVLFGPHMQNFREMTRTFLEANAGIQVVDAAELANEMVGLLSEPARAAEIGRRGKRLAEENGGATERTLDAVRQCLEESQSGNLLLSGDSSR
jgi:3-deoxy-D-manno-octulosonic-acid transferase